MSRGETETAFFLNMSLVTCPSIKDRLEGAAGLIDGNLDKEDFRFAEGGVPHFVNSLRQSDRLARDKRQREWLANRFRTNPEGARLSEFYRQSTVSKYDFEILIETGGELFAANGGEIEHGKESDVWRVTSDK
jgi:hypothetical protein